MVCIRGWEVVFRVDSYNKQSSIFIWCGTYGKLMSFNGDGFPGLACSKLLIVDRSRTLMKDTEYAGTLIIQTLPKVSCIAHST